MLKKISRIIFVIGFFLLIAVPLAATFLQDEKISVDENRTLAKPPEILLPTGGLNDQLPEQTEAWINDHIGFRSSFVRQNGLLRYYLFHKFPAESTKALGPEDELNYVTPEVLLDFQHRNLFEDAYLKAAKEALETVGRWSLAKGAKLYYYQCWDKHSIYPEDFPAGVFQYGAESKTDGLISAFQDQKEAVVISPKRELMENKNKYETYSRWGDPTHWSGRGAYLGYLKFMEAVNRNVLQPYQVLREEDYEISVKDLGQTIYGRLHQEDFLEELQIREPKAVLTMERLTVGADHPRARFYTNESAANKDCLLIFGDSYFHEYILDDIAESFHETVFLWGDQLKELEKAVAAYGPDMILIENAEREDRTGLLISCAEALK